MVLKRINISIPEPLHAHLKKIAKKKGVGVSELLRQAAEQVYPE
jgi:metal-responsive CopG/Arc/MetJ family transcriptional regulator